MGQQQQQQQTLITVRWDNNNNSNNRLTVQYHGTCMGESITKTTTTRTTTTTTTTATATATTTGWHTYTPPACFSELLVYDTPIYINPSQPLTTPHTSVSHSHLGWCNDEPPTCHDATRCVLFGVKSSLLVVCTEYVGKMINTTHTYTLHTHTQTLRRDVGATFHQPLYIYLSPRKLVLWVWFGWCHDMCTNRHHRK